MKYNMICNNGMYCCKLCVTQHEMRPSQWCKHTVLICSYLVIHDVTLPHFQLSCGETDTREVLIHAHHQTPDALAYLEHILQQPTPQLQQRCFFLCYCLLLPFPFFGQRCGCWVAQGTLSRWPPPGKQWSWQTRAVLAAASFMTTVGTPRSPVSLNATQHLLLEHHL